MHSRVADAHALHPKPFVRGIPRSLTLVGEGCINPPENQPTVRTLELPRDIKVVP
jgi:hypothetical protein